MGDGTPAMFTLDELSKKVAAYRDGGMSLRDIRNWFEDNSSGAYGVAELHEACIAIDAAFSEYYYDNIGEAALKKELVKAVRPFAKNLRSWEKVANNFFLLHETAHNGLLPNKTQVVKIEADVSRKPPTSATSSPWFQEFSLTM